MVTKSKVIVLSAMKYSMVNTQTGVINEGVSAFYVDSTTLEPLVDGNFKGYRTGKLSLPIAQAEKFVVVPGIYEVEFEMSINKEGKAILNGRSVDFVSAFSLSTGSDKVDKDVAKIVKN